MTLVSIDTVGPVQLAMFARMADDEQLRDLLEATEDDPRIFDAWAPGRAFERYVNLGGFIENPRNWHGGLGAETVAVVDVWVRAHTDGPGRSIVGRVKALFDHQPIDLGPGLDAVSVKHEQTLDLRDPDPDLRRYQLRIRLTIEQEN
ncbi:tail completion protein gp17 [Nocardioides alkalitolerans]|uniref:tail completion protein gp17 n=1 Tax=Nocardioides alkalitolerans TaxID=281714 RepID=UPI00048AC2B4|nr:DUF3168 domain-containing protein [Nocardioides alkalitolerans]